MIKKVINHVRRKRCIEEQFFMNSDNLVPGEYVFDAWLTYIYFKDDDISKRAESMFSKKPKKTLHILAVLIIRALFFRRKLEIKQSDEIEGFAGTVYLPANNQGENSDAKFFDFENNKVMSILSSEFNYNKKIDDYKRFRKYFPIPTILWGDNQRFLIVEDLIEFRSSRSWMKEERSFINDIFHRYIKYFHECKRNDDFIMTTPKFLFEKLTNDHIKTYLLKNISDELMNKKIPLIKTHGDLWSGNVLLEKGKSSYYYIDWEHATEFSLFYDIFWFMQNEAIYHNNYSLFDNYINGVFDEHFKGMFRIFDMEDYRTEYRQDYFFIFILNVFVTRLANAEQKTKNVVYNQFHDLLKR